MLSTNEISHIARLAKLRLEPEEAQAAASDLSRVLDYIAILDRVEIDSENQQAATSSRLREDEVQDSLAVETLLQNAPESLDRFLLVPAIKK